VIGDELLAAENVGSLGYCVKPSDFDLLGDLDLDG
jgi:hypothetical protein